MSIDIKMKISRTPLAVTGSDTSLRRAALCLFLWSLRRYFSKASSTVLASLSARRNSSQFNWCRLRPRSPLKELPHASHAKIMINSTAAIDNPF
jgi:hypothetical protein